MFSQVTLIGNLGNDPKQTNDDAEKPQVHASIATTDSWQKDGEWQEKPHWHTIMAYGAAAKRMLKMKKGNRVFLQGELNYFPDKEDNEKQGNAFVKVMRPPKDISRNGDATASKETADPNQDEIPF